MIELDKWFIVMVANFLILMFLLNIFLFKPLVALFKERERVKTDSLSEAKSLDSRSNEAMAILKKEIAEAHDVAKSEFMKLRQEGLAIQKELITNGHEESVKRLSAALREISVKTEESKLSLKEDIQKYSDEIMKKLLLGQNK
jgi:F-type H+-transporting ATPase subunit b